MQTIMANRDETMGGILVKKKEKQSLPRGTPNEEVSLKSEHVLLTRWSPSLRLAFHVSKPEREHFDPCVRVMAIR